MSVDEVLWKAIMNCETTFDGKYYYAVISTGIFCRPSCRSRTPRRENVRIFCSVNEAKSAGFRPCKRCRPDERPLGPDAELVNRAKNIIHDRYYERLTLANLAKELVISPYHLHRVFKRLTGVTPAEYILQKRLDKAMAALKADRSRTITEIAFGVGFNSISHFSTVFQRMTGQTPSQYREQTS